MRKYLIVFIFFTVCSFVSAQMTVSGILDTSVAVQAGAGDSPAFSSGFEEYANLRFQARLRERGIIYGAINFIAASGSYAAAIQPMAFLGENFIAAIELERLYFRLNGEHTDFDAGLFRLPFGYGQVWGSSDFLNPKNPLKPDARPRAVLGAAFSWYPIDDLKILGFYAAPRDPFSHEGSLFGISLDRHWEKVSIQTLYSYELPKTGSAYGIHRAGLSVKADLIAGFVMDTLYTYNHAAGTKLDGLSFSFGADYSFFDGNLIVLVEYLYNGKSSSTALGYGGSFFNNHYLYTGFTWRINDFANINIGLICGFNDVSFTPVISFNNDLFQGATLTITAQVPLDRDLFHGDGRRGELGPLRPDTLQPHSPETGVLIGRFGSYFSSTVKIRLRF
ncbi:MAG: hypothetical protein FWD26_09420 [Treponema sp.]|nr:hypothetical protein [Treponema sp.]